MDAERLWRVIIDALDRPAGSTFEEHDDWVQLTTPSSPMPNHNKVLRARIAPGEADARIAEVLDEHRARGASLEWLVDHGSAPADLSERLTRAGAPMHGLMDGMHLAVREHRAPALPTGVDVAPAAVGDESAIARIARIGWNQGEAFERFLRGVARRAIEQPAQRRYWVARLDGEVVGWVTLFELASVGYLQGAAVLPEARGRGIYTALTHTRLTWLQARGIGTAVVWANPETSGPIVERLGFHHAARAKLHRFVPA
jgi:GNAT superfamily N-acetyltransferase